MYLLQEPENSVTLQVWDILLQISLLLSLVSYPVQHLGGDNKFDISHNGKKRVLICLSIMLTC